MVFISTGVIRPLARALLLVVLLVSMLGCAIGANHFSSNRLEYNKAMQVTEQEELLLNIVRLRYNEPPTFLKVSGISAQFEVSSNLKLSAQANRDARVRLLQPEASIGFASRPTVSFLPQQDKQFMQQVMAPVSPETLYRLIEYGWGVDRVFSLLVRQANGVGQPIGLGREELTVKSEIIPLFKQMEQWQHQQLLNLQLASRDIMVMPAVRVEDASIQDVIELRSAGYGLQKQGQDYVLSRKQVSLELIASAALTETAEWQQFADTLRLQADAGHYLINPGAAAPSQSDQLILALRSPLSLMALLSAGVSVPADQVEHRVVTAITTAELPNFQVYSQRRKPNDAYLAVEHRGNWFYIRDDDLDSRRSLGLLSTLMRQEVQAGGAQNLPVLTLPVGR